VIAAVVPAAGRGSRMGRPKLTLPVGGRPIIERVVAALRGGGVDRVLVVVGPHDPGVAPLAAAAGAEVCELPHATADMRATVEYGLAWLEDHGPPDAWLLAPADYPALDAESVKAILATHRREPTLPVIAPTFGGRRGHPVLIAWRLVAGLRVWPDGRGIDDYLRQFEREALDVPVAKAGVVQDVDTPEDHIKVGGV
jgi:molybdenum cofactor cytidylyltransferase